MIATDAAQVAEIVAAAAATAAVMAVAGAAAAGQRRCCNHCGWLPWPSNDYALGATWALSGGTGTGSPALIGSSSSPEICHGRRRERRGEWVHGSV